MSTNGVNALTTPEMLLMIDDRSLQRKDSVHFVVFRKIYSTQFGFWSSNFTRSLVSG